MCSFTIIFTVHTEQGMHFLSFSPPDYILSLWFGTLVWPETFLPHSAVSLFCICILHGQGSLGRLTLSKILGNGSARWGLKGYHPSSCLSSAFLEKLFFPLYFFSLPFCI